MDHKAMAYIVMAYIVMAWLMVLLIVASIFTILGVEFFYGQTKRQDLKK